MEERECASLMVATIQGKRPPIICCAVNINLGTFPASSQVPGHMKISSSPGLTITATATSCLIALFTTSLTAIASECPLFLFVLAPVSSFDMVLPRLPPTPCCYRQVQNIQHQKPHQYMQPSPRITDRWYNSPLLCGLRLFLSLAVRSTVTKATITVTSPWQGVLAQPKLPMALTPRPRSLRSVQHLP